MKKLVLLFIILTSALRAGNEIYFASEPCLTPNGKSIIFCYEDDIWTVPAEGGPAFRLTGMAGRESNPVVSPDGKWLAFTGRQDGNANIYIIPLEGGSIKQLTFYECNNTVSSWSWDSKDVFFTSDRYNSMTTFKVSINGGTPVRLFDNYFNRPHNLSVNPKTGAYIFTDSWESSIFAMRKRYKGAFNPDIKSFNPKTGEYKLLTAYSGKDLWPTVDINGNIYFASDSANEEYNLYSFDNNGQRVQLTSFNSSIKNPRVNSNGGFVVFEKDYQIYLYDSSNKNSRRVQILLPTNNILGLEQNFNVKGKITSFDVSPDQKKLAFVSRGELFVSDIEGKFIKQLSTLPEGRVMEVLWNDSLNIIFNQTVNGWLNLFSIKADGSSDEKQFTFDQRNNRNISLNKEKTEGLYLSGRDELRLLDLKSLNSETIVKDEFWGFDNSTPYFSPDNKYVLYTAYKNFEQDIFLYNIDSKKSVNITNTGVTEADPYWSPDGKYIYFETDRYQPSYPYGFENANIYRIALNKFDNEFKSTKFESLFDKAKKNDSSKNDIKIDFNNIEDRWEQITSAKGNQLNPYIIKKPDETTILFISNQDGDEYTFWKTVLKPFEKPETKKIESPKIDGLQIAKGTSKYYMLAGGDINEIDIEGSKLKKIDIDFDFSRNLKSEFNEMFFETWANLDENYYDDQFHGTNWENMKDHYASFLPYLSSRNNLRVLLTDLEGELNSSHQGFYSSGSEEKTFYNEKTQATGIMFDNENPLLVDRILKNSPADKEDIDIKKGDILSAVNGKKIDTNVDREYYFQNPTLSDEITLTFLREGKEILTKIHPERVRSLTSQLYDEWIDNNKNYVAKKSDDKIAYVYMKDMVPESLKKFLIDMTSGNQDKKGLILDLRYNTGGNVHNQVLQFLSQRPYLKWKYRDGKFAIQPNFTPSANPMVLLVNEQTLSDAEMTSTGFKALKLGKIIGTETYRWIIFTSGKSLVDGSFYRLPSWGCFTLDGKDIEKNGVSPDIYVNTTIKDRVEWKDPQLDKAIEEIKSELKE
ncbi:MAG: S41 family peptidase [Ignavibacteriaceae bacterium]